MRRAPCSLPPFTIRAQETTDRVTEVRVGHGQHRSISVEEVRGTALELGAARTDRGTKPPTNPVAIDRGSATPPDGVRDPWRQVRPVEARAKGDGACPMSGRPGEGLEGRTVADAPDQAESRFRPRARRERSTARPPRDRIRTRKPWVFLRLRVFGWYVRFKSLASSRSTARGSKQGPAREAVNPECTGARRS